MGNVVKFERYKHFKDPSIQEILDYVKEHKWPAFQCHWEKWMTTGDVVVERLPG